jgi:hypothetical protein
MCGLYDFLNYREKLLVYLLDIDFALQHCAERGQRLLSIILATIEAPVNAALAVPELLGHVLICPLAAWLREEGATSITLIPSGVLASFPLLAAPIGDDKTSWQALGTTLPASVAPSALSLLPGARPEARRSGVRAIGNPLPTPQHLEWGEAEALTLTYLGGDRDRTAVRTGYEAVRTWFIEAAEQASVLDVPCHGLASGDDLVYVTCSLSRVHRL